MMVVADSILDRGSELLDTCNSSDADTGELNWLDDSHYNYLFC